MHLAVWIDREHNRVCIDRIKTQHCFGGSHEIEATRRLPSATSADRVLRRIEELWKGGRDPVLIGCRDSLLMRCFVRGASERRAKMFHVVRCADEGVALESLSGVALDSLMAQRVALDNLARRVVIVFMKAC